MMRSKAYVWDTGLMQIDIPCTSHRLVAISLMEAYMRYARVLQSEPGQACLPRVLGVFLGSCGIGHPDEVKRNQNKRKCYGEIHNQIGEHDKSVKYGHMSISNVINSNKV